MHPTKSELEKTYKDFNKPEFIHPDPLEFVWRYKGGADREIVGLIAACLAYGNVTQILKSVEKVLGPMGPSPAAWLKKADKALIKKTFAAFKHRFTTGAEMSVFLLNIKQAREKHGSLEKLFLLGYDPSAATVKEMAFSMSVIRPQVPHWRNGTNPVPASSWLQMNVYESWVAPPPTGVAVASTRRGTSWRADVERPNITGA